MIEPLASLRLQVIRCSVMDERTRPDANPNQTGAARINAEAERDPAQVRALVDGANWVQEGER